MIAGLDEKIINRHPFPGPGLGVRILGEITIENCNLLREADSIFIEELKKRRLYNEIWQAFSVCSL
jgi:GMP synthase (glutamine-hydrolysing)